MNSCNESPNANANNYQRFDDDSRSNYGQNTYGTNPSNKNKILTIQTHALMYVSFIEYGSMLCYNCSDSFVSSRMSPRDDINSPNEFSHRVVPRGSDSNNGGGGGGGDDNAAENAAFARQTIMMDADMHWEMNYHEAAIFLEVYIILK